MNINILASCTLALGLMGCSGNSLNNPLIFPEEITPGEPTDEGDGTAITASSPVVVPDDLAFNLANAKIIRGTGGDPDTLLVNISALDATPIEATWQRRPALDIPGYQAFAVQEDALDRLFIGLAATSADGSASAVLAGDGGQFGSYFSGTKYDREGAYTPPDATAEGPGRGQVSYTGKYAGLLNGGGAGDDLLPIPAGRPAAPSEAPTQATQITGDVFVNANFADDVVNGIVKNRNAIDLDITSDVGSANHNDGTGVRMEDLNMVPTAILANGTFGADLERGPIKKVVGTYGGAFGGTDASSIAGGVHVTDVYNGAGEKIENALERGVFVLDQCGVTASGGDCIGTAP
ncbi:thymidylate synthase (plasmid) [Pseudorhodobacter turbinis]|uniref:Thymidylate synthase n=1 Tax=Pseudorhodobacter turbinis TaxID=2500533 RepID=A0A4P8EJH5_9RHOB|nr:thymidylate synthase [Pseudorhodobacter turbinis]QCO57003.1 thymidylate synthase [Pseudorhodobacter turbinis]